MGTRDLNKIMLTGQVAAEPEMRFTAEGEPHTTFYLTCADSRESTTAERFRLVAWRAPLAERCNDLLQGAKVLVEGRLQSCTADNEAKRARFPFEVRVRECLVLDPGDAAAMMVPASPRPPTPPTRMVNLPTMPRSSAPHPPARPAVPAMPSRPATPRPPGPAMPARRSTLTTVATVSRSSTHDPVE